MGRVPADINDELRQRIHHNASRLIKGQPLRAGISLDQAREVRFTYIALEIYEILVIHQHWSINRYADFVYRRLVAELLDYQRK